ncbi:hypothetical protein INR77_04720 [Erythrobacter sp. SCSIO 43205]|uniref:hypothetical protein n=1 Tax=Erythrobacter sp. SCSIO 43205 TaxID=2779361 RepID=UPI001CA86439|nr:hypothetical protein [Erythrobacter sp. SCSIO 43205]UAB79004.1 hypothetical protein INR77_04720 [Erythrobacter sp. SCSIO 43205]
MGRSVSHPAGAVVAFRMLDRDGEDDLQWTYECLVEDILHSARDAFPSLEPYDGWRGREDRILLRNAFADCGISTYCGLAAIWLARRDDSRFWEADCDQPQVSLAERWITQVGPRFEKLFGELKLVGRFSNGEAIYERTSSCI